MSTMASARIDEELYIQGRDVLEEIGATQTQLINAAYRYVVREKALPGNAAAERQEPKGRERRMSAEQRERMRGFFESITMPAGTLGADLQDLDGAEYDALLGRALRDGYEGVR